MFVLECVCVKVCVCVNNEIWNFFCCNFSSFEGIIKNYLLSSVSPVMFGDEPPPLTTLCIYSFRKILNVAKKWFLDPKIYHVLGVVSLFGVITVAISEWMCRVEFLPYHIPPPDVFIHFEIL